MITKFLSGILLAVLLSCKAKTIPTINTVRFSPSEEIQKSKDLKKADEFYSLFNVEHGEVASIEKIDRNVRFKDSINFRLWLVNSNFSKFELYSIKFTDLKWEGIYCSLIRQEEYAGGKIILQISEIKNIVPKAGWKYFDDSLNKLQVFSLPDSDSIPEINNTWALTNNIFVEASKGEKYRFYSYPDSESYLDKSGQTRRVSEIRNLFESELHD